MKKILSICLIVLFLVTLVVYTSSYAAKGCHVFGKIKYVTYGEDYKVKIVTYGEDLKVKIVKYGSDKVGNWEIVDYGEKFKVKIVDYGEDFKVKLVDYGEGCN